MDLLILSAVYMVILVFVISRERSKVQKGLVDKKPETESSTRTPKEMFDYELKGNYFDRVQMPSYVRMRFPGAKAWEFQDRNTARRWNDEIIGINLYFLNGEKKEAYINRSEVTHWDRRAKGMPQPLSPAHGWMFRYTPWLTEMIEKAKKDGHDYLWVDPAGIEAAEDIAELRSLVETLVIEVLGSGHIVSILDDNRMEIALHA